MVTGIFLVQLFFSTNIMIPFDFLWFFFFFGLKLYFARDKYCFPRYFWLIFAWNIFFSHLLFSILIFKYYRWYIIGSFSLLVWVIFFLMSLIKLYYHNYIKICFCYLIEYFPFHIFSLLFSSLLFIGHLGFLLLVLKLYILLFFLY